MVWSVDGDDSSFTLSNIVSSICDADLSESINYECSPLRQGQRCWWTPEDQVPGNEGRCGPSAPLYNGNVPKCDPDDSSYNCCGKFGYCGSGDDYCKCDECINFTENLDLLKECK